MLFEQYWINSDECFLIPSFPKNNRYQQMKYFFELSCVVNERRNIIGLYQTFGFHHLAGLVESASWFFGCKVNGKRSSVSCVTKSLRKNSDR